MGVWQKIKNAFKDEAEITVQNTEAINGNVTWETYCTSAIRIWQLQYALSVVANRLGTFLSNAEWNTFSKGKVVKGDEWFRFNVAPNRRQTINEFYEKLAHKLVFDGEALIIETAQREFYIADSYSFKAGQELQMKENTFIGVTIGDVTLNRSFKENDSCIYLKTPNYETVDQVFNSMQGDFANLKELIYEGAQKALGMKLSLNLAANSKNKYDGKVIEQLQKIYEPLMNSRNAVFITYNGEKLEDLTERQRGSEVQQVLEAVENNIKINEEILNNVGSAFGLPQHFMDSKYTADNQDTYIMAMTMFVKPYLALLSQKYTFFVMTKEDIIAGGKIEADLNSIRYNDALMVAGAVDKLIGSGAYSPNEVREKLGDDPFDGGDTKFITKNYAVFSEYVRGGDG